MGRLARRPSALCRSRTPAALLDALHLGHDRPRQGHPPLHRVARGGASCRRGHGAERAGGVWPGGRGPRAVAGPALSQRAEHVRDPGAAAGRDPLPGIAFRRRAGPGPDCGTPDRPGLPRAHHVQPAAQAPGGGQGALRRVQPAPCHHHGLDLRTGIEAGHDRLVGAGDPRKLRRQRTGPGHVHFRRGSAGAAGIRRPADRGHDAPDPRRRRRAAAPPDARPHLRAPGRLLRLHLQPQRRGAPQARARRALDAARRRLAGRGRLPLPRTARWTW